MKHTEIKDEKTDKIIAVEHTLEVGDIIVPQYDSVYTSDKGKFKNFFLGIKTEKGEDFLVKLTKGQAKRLKGFEPLTGKKFVAVMFENEFGEFVGLDNVPDKTDKETQKEVTESETDEPETK